MEEQAEHAPLHVVHAPAPHRGFAIETHLPRHGSTLVVVRGEVDAGTAPEFHRRLARAVRGASRVLLDLAGVTALSPEGVDALLDVERDVAMELLSPSPSLVLLLHEAAGRGITLRDTPGGA